MHHILLESIDEIDAAVINSDVFLDDDNRQYLEIKLSRWEKQLKKLKNLSEEVNVLEKLNDID